MGLDDKNEIKINQIEALKYRNRNREMQYEPFKADGLGDFIKMFNDEMLTDIDEDEKYLKNIKDFIVDLYRNDTCAHSIIRTLEKRHWKDFESHNLNCDFVYRQHPLDYLMNNHLNELALNLTVYLFQKVKDLETERINQLMHSIRTVRTDLRSENK